MQQAWGRVKLTEVNPHLVCVLCHGYFIDATTMVECPHSFCRSCIILYLETKSYCPICEVQIHKTKPHLNLKPDKTLQDIVYKLVPGLFHSEMRRRREFYTKHPNRDLYLNPEARGVGVERIIYSPEDSISLSLEYYDEEREKEEWGSRQPGITDVEKKSPNRPSDGLKRYLQCPAVVTMSQIKKFIRMKYNLAATCSVEVLYRRESLPDSYSLMDVAYIYTWKRNGPMRFYYRIHVSVPVTQCLPVLEKPSVTEIPCEEPQRETKLEPSDCTVDKPNKPDVVPLPPRVESTSCDKTDKVAQETTLLVADNATKVEMSTAVNRPYASEHDELSVRLLLSLSNGHPRESNKAVTPTTQPEADNKKPEHNGVDPTHTVVSANHLMSTAYQNSKNTETNEETSKITTSVNGYTQHLNKVNTPVINGTCKPLHKNPIKPLLKGNLNAKTNNQIIKNILANKLTDGRSLSTPKPIQNHNENNPNPCLPSKNQNIISEAKKLPEENKSDDPLASTKELSAAEKALKTAKLVQSSQLKHGLKKIDPVKGLVNCPKPESKPERIVNNALDNKTDVISNNQDKIEMKAVEATTNNVQPLHRKEVNRLEQIVKNCMKKSNNNMVNKSVENNLSNGEMAKPDSVEETAKWDVTTNFVNKDLKIPVGTDIIKEETSILKRKLKDTACLISVNRDSPSLLGPSEAKKRRLVTPDVSIELTTHPAYDNRNKSLKRPAECSDLSILTKRFLDSIQQMKKHVSTAQEFSIKDIDQLCASNVKIEKVPASNLNSVPNKTSQNILGKSDEKKCSSNEANRDKLNCKKKDDLVSIAIERINENLRMSERSNEDNKTSTETQGQKEQSDTDPVPSTSADKELPSPASLKKLPRLIEINAPPRPKLPTSLQDPKNRTGLKMTTVRKEVPIGKESPLVWKDNAGALDLSSGSPGSPKSKATINPRPSGSSKSPSLSPLQAMSSFQVPDMKTSPTLRIPNLKHKTPPHLQPRSSSLSSSSPSPPGDSRTAEMFSNTSLQQLYRHQLELQSRLMASSQVNNNKWRQDPLTAKKFEEWMRNMINCGGLPPHPLMFSPNADTLRK